MFRCSIQINSGMLITPRNVMIFSWNAYYEVYSSRKSSTIVLVSYVSETC